MNLRHPFGGHGNKPVPGMFRRAVRADAISPVVESDGRLIYTGLRGGPVYLDEFDGPDGRFHIAYVGLADDLEAALALASDEADERGVPIDHILFSSGKAA